jgi:hypothetical protein
MRVPIDDPESLGDLSGPGPYTVMGFRTEIRRLSRSLARLRNLIRMAEALSTDKRVKAILKEALSENFR